MRYLGVDPSLNGTGLCSVTDDGAVVHLATVDPGELRGEARLDVVERAVKSFLDQGAALVAIEGYAYHAVGDQVFQLGEVGGIVRLLAFRSGTPYIVIAPMLLKKFATGSPSAEKAHMIKAAEALGACPGDDDNQADAFFLARVALVSARPTAAKARRELEVVHRLRNPPPKKKQRRARRLIPNAL